VGTLGRMGRGVLRVGEGIVVCSSPDYCNA
jgi:hypothetical protein